MTFYLLVKSGCEYPDLEDECVAKDKRTAMRIFNARHGIDCNEWNVCSEADFKEAPCLVN